MIEPLRSCMQATVYLFVHLGAIGIVTVLWPRAPDLVQRVFLTAIGASMLVYLFCDFLVLYGIDNQPGGPEFYGISRVWPIKGIAGVIAHAALLVYLVRQWWIKTKMCESIREIREHGKHDRRVA